MDAIEYAKVRYAKLKAQIEAADAVRPEFQKLGEFLKVAEELKRQQLEGQRTTLIAARAQVVVRPVGEATSEMAEKILDKFGPKLSVVNIITRLKEIGWRGSGDERKDYKNVYTNLSTKPHRFRNVGGAVFERVRTVSK